jgi:tetratricopeptide (TPR) repeat protein
MVKLAQLPANDGAPPAAAAKVHRITRPRARYYAFLSYSHKDSELADWLHRQLEDFRVPHALAGKLTSHGVVPRRLTPIFRDRHELAAADDLGAEIRVALESSQYLIVLCSPDAAISRWTNAEIEEFKRTRPEACVLAAIVSGEPFASDVAGRESEECFPPALRYKYDRRGRITTKRAEPLAADLRDGADGRRMGFLKLVAGMLGVGLDDLVQREATRRQRRLAMLAAGSLAGMAVTSTLAVTAFQSRNEAREQRRQAEGLVGFMLGDLKDKLQPIGRLDALDAVGSRALAYYQNQDKSELSDEALGQRSRALTLMGEIAQIRGDLPGAQSRYQEALASTGELLRRDPANGQKIFDHAQNVFYVGFLADQRNQRSQAERAFREYKRLADQLVTLDPNRKEWQLEPIYADTNLGLMLLKEKKFQEAAAIFQHSLPAVEGLVAGDPGNRDYQDQLSETLADLSQSRESEGALDDALAQRERQAALLEAYAAKSGTDAALKRKMMAAQRALGRLYAEHGDVAQGFDHLERAAALAAELSSTEPANTEWAEYRAGTLIDLGELQYASGRIADAGGSSRLACDIADRLTAKDPTVVAWSGMLRTDCLSLKARLALATGSREEARSLSEQALAVSRRQVAKSGSADDRIRLAESLLLRGQVARAMGDRQFAMRSLQEADSVWPTGVQLIPPYLVSRAAMLAGLGRGAESAAIVARLQAMGYRHPALAQQLRMTA